MNNEELIAQIIAQYFIGQFAIQLNILYEHIELYIKY